jgi:two-component system, LytTR family, response regulator LytT
MKVLIIEDELYTGEHLKKLLIEIDSSLRIAPILDSVEKSVNWLNNNDSPDLIFQDIMLKDGNCFELFERVEIKSPVIFTTAYSEYALQAFQVNSIDYLIKPYDIDDISRVLNKYREFSIRFQRLEGDLVKEILTGQAASHKRRFLIKTGDTYRSLKSDEIAYFFYDEGITFGVTRENKKFVVETSVSDLNNQLDEQAFFQINRKFIINIEYIAKISKWFNNRLKVETDPKSEEEMIVSREKVKLFKSWLDS